MPGSGRPRVIGAIGALLLALGLAVAATRPSALAAPSTFQIVVGGYGHGIGMSQYGAHGMALRGASAGRIISFYYGGASARPATLPATIRVGLLQANRDPSTGGRLGRVLVRGIEVPGLGGSGGFTVAGVATSGRVHTRALAGHVTWSIRPEAGGTSVFDPNGSRVFGPTRAGAGVVVRDQTSSRPARLLPPQTGQQLRWGRLDVHLVGDDHGTLRQRAVAVVPFNHYLRGLAEMPGRRRDRPAQADSRHGRGGRLGRQPLTGWLGIAPGSSL